MAYLDMTDPNINFPSGWQLTAHSKRTCGTVSAVGLTCDSVFFRVSGGAYTRVCGRIKRPTGHSAPLLSHRLRTSPIPLSEWRINVCEIGVLKDY